MDYRPYPYLAAAIERYYAIRTPLGRTKPLRVLLATFWKYPQRGGLSKYIGTLKQGLEQLGHHVDIVDYRADQALSHDLKVVVENYFLQRYRTKNKRIVEVCQKLWSYESQLRCMGNLASYDVLHAQDRFSANVLGKLNLDYQVPLFYTPHQLGVNRSLRINEIEAGSIEEAFYRAIDQAALRYAWKIITICNVFHEPLTQLGASPDKLHTVYTGVYPNVSRAPIRAKTNLVITSVSRITPRKGHKYLLEALALIREHLTNVRVVIVGDGDARKSVEKLARDLKLDQVIFAGYRENIADILSTSDIFVHPTTSDMVPISVIEAMFAGLPIITTRVNGIPEIIRHNETGLIVEPGNVQPLAEKLTLLIHDANLRNALGSRAQQYAQNHLRADAMAEQIAAIYHSVV